ncbi:acyl-CoA thioester hydrolase [Salsuginibacillus halophilus]|uniref:Acyl-CoA thioester hydrolase n=1 Tax=Salsuginibacillus halophilus TaxID=517424 RepID=A0A2P8HYN6_9BACI|nr:thioesterase family protein [Salsuginibacillus halophilus]PSL51329.1 acyl-CoA thioester hydrolase [Salsuginibacillus halophilus]
MSKAETRIEIRYAETDQMGVVHHSNYLVWCELGRSDLFRQLGFSYKEMEDKGLLAPVTEVNLNYKQPAHYGEDIYVYTWIQGYNGLRVSYAYTIQKPCGTVCVDGTTTHVCVDKDTFRPKPLRRVMPELHEVYEKVKLAAEVE